MTDLRCLDLDLDLDSLPYILADDIPRSPAQHKDGYRGGEDGN